MVMAEAKITHERKGIPIGYWSQFSDKIFLWLRMKDKISSHVVWLVFSIISTTNGT